jgi:hypothetical protein
MSHAPPPNTTRNVSRTCSTRVQWPGPLDSGPPQVPAVLTGQQWGHLVAASAPPAGGLGGAAGRPAGLQQHSHRPAGGGVKEGGG